MKNKVDEPAAATERTLSLRAELGLALALTVACLLPFLNKAFHIDDPLFLWTAQQISRSPLDFYGFDVNWSGSAIPMSVEMKNPPLTSYYQAAVGRVAGFGELAMHLAFLPFAMATVAGVVLLGRRFAAAGLLPGMLTLASPAFLISASSVMSDGMMLALWTWAVVLWVWGLDKNSPRLLIAAGGLIALATLTKYPAMCLVPWLAVYGILRRRMWIWQSVAILLPVAALVAYQLWTAKLYGHGLVSDAGTYAIEAKSSPMLTSAFVGLAILGGSVLGPALVIASIATRRGWVFAAVFGAVGFIAGLALKQEGLNLIEFVLMMIGGAAVVGIAWQDLRQSPTPDAALLAMGVAGVFVFGAFVNWTINSRSFLPLTPVAAVLAARALKSAAGLRMPPSDWNARQWIVGSAVAVGLMVSLWVTAADYRWAGASRALARQLQEFTKNAKGRVWFTGHWGFMWYMQPFAKSVDGRRSVIEPGDFIAIYLKTSDPSKLPKPAVEIVQKLQAPAGARISIAAAYSDRFGVLPYIIGRSDLEEVWLFRAKARLRLGSDSEPANRTTQPSHLRNGK